MTSRLEAITFLDNNFPNHFYGSSELTAEINFQLKESSPNIISLYEKENHQKDLYNISTLSDNRSRPIIWLDITVPLNGPKRSFKNGYAGSIATNLKTIHLFNFNVGTVYFTDSHGKVLKEKGFVILEGTSKIDHLKESNGFVIRNICRKSLQIK